MRLTIIKSDNAVILNGERHTVDCSNLPTDFHALQWNDTEGEIEYNMTRCEHCGARSKKGNALISDLVLYQPYIDGWKVAAIAADETKKTVAADLAIAAVTNAAGP